MPKLFGSAISGLAVVVLATGLVGCRSATTQLASVPGLGWLDRGDEGWANYEPAPGLPKPSATTEPTSGGPAANIASKDKSQSPFDNPVSKIAKNDSDSRFDRDRYIPKKSEVGTPGKAKTFGDYASAYGKFTPPSKSDTKKDFDAQAGPYSVNGKKDLPNFASTTGMKNEVAAAKDFVTNSEAPKFGATLKEKFGAEATAAADTLKAPAYTANSNSRFGAPEFKNPKVAASGSTYTPPGFPSSSKTEAVAGRFGEVSSAASNAANQASRFANNTMANVNNVAKDTLSNGQQTFNRFGNNATSTANNTMAQATNAVSNNASQVYNRFSNELPGQAQAGQATNTLNNVANAATNKLNNVTNNVANNIAGGRQALTNSFTGNTNPATRQNSLLDSAKKTFGAATGSANSSINNTVNNTVNNAMSGVKDYAAGYQNAAAGAVKDVQNRFGNVASPKTPSFSQTLQNPTQSITQGVTNQVQSYAQNAVNTVEQGVATQYQQAKSTVGNYANSAMNNVAQGASSMVNSATGQASQLPAAGTAQNLMNSAAAGVNQARSAIQGYAAGGQNTINNAVNNVMQNVGTSGQAPPVSYPSTSTPNPFLNPPKALQQSVTPPPAAPSYNAPSFNAPNFAPPVNAPATIQRESLPFLPGSTKSYQGATTVRKQEVELASATSQLREPLMLAVGDQYQFQLRFDSADDNS